MSRLVPLELRFKLVGLGAKSGFGVSGEVIFGDRKRYHGVKHSRPPPSGLNLRHGIEVRATNVVRSCGMQLLFRGFFCPVWFEGVGVF